MVADIENIVVVTEDDAKLEIRAMQVDGKLTMVREEQPALLGKRYVCGYPVAHNNNTVNLAGNMPSTDGKSVYMGCGTTVLCTKKGGANAVPYCCGTPMALLEPRKLPSSD